jgi:diguanylate cyclase (GGDEF)-like protein
MNTSKAAVCSHSGSLFENGICIQMAVAGGSGGTVAAGDDVARRPILRARSWELWSVDATGRYYMLAVEVAAAVILALALTAADPTSTDLARLATLAGLAAICTESVAYFSRLRLWLGGDRVRADHLSVWTVAAALLVPAGYAGLLTALGSAYIVLRTGRGRGLRPYREIFATSTATLGILAASAVYHAISELVPSNEPVRALAIVAAVLTSAVLSLCLLTAGIVLVVRPPTLRSVLPNRDVAAFEIASLIVGALTADVIRHTAWLTPALLILLGVLQRSAMVSVLEVEAGTDDKTGLLTAGAWRRLADRHLARSSHNGEPSSLLLIDLDHFKQVNDTHGHLAGDEALRAVAECLRTDLRGHDAVGRYGGEEFVVLLPGIDRAGALGIALRLTSCIRGLAFGGGMRLTASIGVAIASEAARTLDELIATADVALYAAKASGRDQVRFCDSPTPARG